MKICLLGLPRMFILAVAASLALSTTVQARVLKVQTSQNAGDFTFEHLKNVWTPKLKSASLLNAGSGPLAVCGIFWNACAPPKTKRAL